MTDTREKFEKWLTEFIWIQPPLEGKLDSDGRYIYNDLEIQKRWTTWQASEDHYKEREQLAYREASDLAMAIWRDFYKDDSPKFELCDSTAGIISQIDNMYTGLRERIVELEKDAERLDWLQKHFDSALTREAIDNSMNVMKGG